MLKLASRAAAASAAPTAATATGRIYPTPRSIAPSPAAAVVTGAAPDRPRPGWRCPRPGRRCACSSSPPSPSPAGGPDPPAGGRRRDPPARREAHLLHSLRDGTLRSKLRSRRPTVGVVTGLHGDTDHAETFGLLGYDFLWADAEHSSASPEGIASLILAAERRGMPTLVRIGYGYQTVPGHAHKCLSAGAQGIILPQCEGRGDAELIVDAVKFPPLGRRGLAGERWNAWCLGGGGDMGDRARECNDNSVVGVVVESRRGVDALDEILGVDELDFVFVAPTDLSSDMGLHGQIRHPDVVAKVEEAGQKIRDRGVSAGMLALTPDDYRYWRNRGFNVMCTVAHNLLMDGARGMMNEIVEYELTGMRRLKRAALRVMASQLTKDEVGSLEGVFNSIDLNSDGRLSLDELDVAISDGNFSSALCTKLRSLRDDLALTGHDSLDWKDFLVRAMEEEGPSLLEDRIRRAYDHMRKAGRGGMTISDLNEAFGGEDVAREVLADVDANKDEQVSYEEFRDALVAGGSGKEK